MTIDRLWYWFCDYFLASRNYGLATVTVRERDSQVVQTYLEIGNSYSSKAKYKR